MGNLPYTEDDMHVYYPEMGEKADPAALFTFRGGHGRYCFVDWPGNRHDEAIAIFQSLKIRPRGMSIKSLIENGPRAGTTKSSACVTETAANKLRHSGLAQSEALLD